LKNIVLGYQFKERNTHFSMRMFVSAQNLFTVTKYMGYDPEIAGGTDTGAYPTAKSFSVGVSLSLH